MVMWKKPYFIFCILILYRCSASPLIPTTSNIPAGLPSPTAEWQRAGWQLVWHDEFDGATLDRANWNFDLGGGGWGNQEAEAYTDRPENIRVQDGRLVIKARREAIPIDGYVYSSARIKTEGLHAWQYGRIEARIKLPKGQGLWPAFWIMGDDIEQKGWPACGAVDIMELIGSQPDLIYAHIHGPGYSGSSGIGTGLAVGPETLQDDFHVYAIEWDQDGVRWYFDDQLYFTITPQDVPGHWVFDHPFFIVLNLAVGGSWPGYPDSSTNFPQDLLVDYVRVYQRP
jgi:beta-glucanase (GH16 family)